MCSSPSAPFAHTYLCARTSSNVGCERLNDKCQQICVMAKGNCVNIIGWNVGLFIVGVFILMCLMSAVAVNQCTCCMVKTPHFNLIKFGNVLEIETLEPEKRTHSFWCAILSIYCHNGIVLMWWSFTQPKGTASPMRPKHLPRTRENIKMNWLKWLHDMDGFYRSSFTSNHALSHRIRFPLQLTSSQTIGTSTNGFLSQFCNQFTYIINK